MKHVIITLVDGSTIEGIIVSDFGDTHPNSHDSDLLIDTSKGIINVEVWYED